MLGPILGGTSYTFGLILAVALLGIGLGGLAYGWGARERRPTLGGFAVTCALEALALGAALRARRPSRLPGPGAAAARPRRPHRERRGVGAGRPRWSCCRRRSWPATSSRSWSACWAAAASASAARSGWPTPGTPPARSWARSPAASGCCRCSARRGVASGGRPARRPGAGRGAGRRRRATALAGAGAAAADRGGGAPAPARRPGRPPRGATAASAPAASRTAATTPTSCARPSKRCARRWSGRPRGARARWRCAARTISPSSSTARPTAARGATPRPR